MPLTTNGSLKKSKKKFKKYMETREVKHATIQNLWDVAKAALKRKVYSDTSLPQERNISNQECDHTLSN